MHCPFYLCRESLREYRAAHELLDRPRLGAAGRPSMATITSARAAACCSSRRRSTTGTATRVRIRRICYHQAPLTTPGGYTTPICERRQAGPEVGPTSAFYSCIPTGMYGPTCIIWWNLTPFSLEASSRSGATRVATTVMGKLGLSSRGARRACAGARGAASGTRKRTQAAPLAIPTPRSRSWGPRNIY